MLVTNILVIIYGVINPLKIEDRLNNENMISEEESPHHGRKINRPFY